MQIESKPKTKTITVRDLDFVFDGNVILGVTLYPEDTYDVAASVILIKYNKTGEISTLHRDKILWSSVRERTITVKDEVVVSP